MASEQTHKIKKSLFIRPLFKRPVGAKTTRISTEETNLFQRSNSSYQAVFEKEERRLARRVAKSARRSQELSNREGLAGDREKRRRISISSSESSSSEGSDIEKRSSQTRSSPNSPPQTKIVPHPASLSINNVTTTTRRNEGLDAERESQDTIGGNKSNENDGGDVVITSIYSRRITTPQPRQDLVEEEVEEEEDAESDDELAELARQARAAAQMKQETSQSQLEDATQSFRRNTPFHGNHRDEQTANARAPAVRFAVNSPLPGGERKRFKRPLEKRLRELRLRWCEENVYTEEEAKRIILVFRGKRVFDVNTPASLGIYVDDEGNAHVEGEEIEDMDEDGCAVMEAINEDDLDAYVVRWARAHGTNESSYNDGLEYEAPVQTPEPPPPDPKNIKIICRARGLDDFKVMVKESTTVARIKSAFIVQHKLPEDTEVTLIFDGENLMPHTTMNDLGVDDMDIFDVQLA